MIEIKLKSKNIIKYLGLGLLFLVTVYTRFYNLGYSDYIGDEHKAFVELFEDQTVVEFFMNQRKGPMQWVVSEIPHLITGDFRNELAQRIPFSIISTAAVFVFFFLVKKITDNFFTAFLSAFLFTINGFIVGFGRIAQYQSLNMLFSFIALYFYADLLYSGKSTNFLKSSMFGTLFWCLSILSHWDAIFILPVVVIVFIKYFLQSETEKSEKIKLFLTNFLLGSAILLPFLIPYVYFQVTNPDNMGYFGRRIEIGHILFDRYRLLINLYNPFVTYYFLFVLGLLGTIFYKRSYLFTSWFVFAYASFELFVRKPGTHIYNFIIPLIVLTSISITVIYEKAPRILRILWMTLVTLVLIFLTYQTHYIFIDHTEEYPWEQKTLLDLTKIQDKKYKKKKIRESEREYFKIVTPKYYLDQKLPLFGFPHKRYWNEINEYLVSQNRKNGEELEYITNEVKTISEWYMDLGYGNDRPFYLVGIIRPLSFVKDYSWPQYGKKEVIHKIENEQGETVVKIYRAEVRDRD